MSPTLLMCLNDFVKGRIISLSEEGKTQEFISKKLSISQSTVSRTINKYKNTGNVNNLANTSRPRIFDTDDRSIVLSINKKNPKFSLRKISKEYRNSTGKDISYGTVKNILNEANIFSFSSIKKPFLSKKNILNRVIKARKFLTLSNNDIKKIIFSDESKFELCNSNKKDSVWRAPATGLQMKNLTPTFKFGGGSVMAWGCFSYEGVGNLIFIDGIMDSYTYVEILSNYLHESAEIMGLEDFIFQQDNDPKHTSKLAKTYFEEKEIKLLDWPAQSPDMNPIETLWGIIKGELEGFVAKNKEELKRKITDIWYSIPVELCQSLALSFKKRCQLVLQAKGGHIKY